MAKKEKVKFTGQVETIEQYLARGGTITLEPEKVRDPQLDVIRKTVAGGPAVFLSLEEADLFFGEARKNAKPKKPKATSKIDLNALPPALRAKFIAKLKEESNGEDYQEELEEIGQDNEETESGDA